MPFVWYANPWIFNSESLSLAINYGFSLSCSLSMCVFLFFSASFCRVWQKTKRIKWKPPIWFVLFVSFWREIRIISMLVSVFVRFKAAQQSRCDQKFSPTDKILFKPNKCRCFVCHNFEKSKITEFPIAQINSCDFNIKWNALHVYHWNVLKSHSLWLHFQSAIAIRFRIRMHTK